MIREIERARPKFLFVLMPDSWLQRPESERSIFTRDGDYTAQNYIIAGFVKMVAPDRADYYFGSVPAISAAFRKLHFDPTKGNPKANDEIPMTNDEAITKLDWQNTRHSLGVFRILLFGFSSSFRTRLPRPSVTKTGAL